MLYGELQRVTLGESEFNGFRFTVKNPPKTAILRLPSSIEMIARIDGQKSIRSSIGRRKSSTETIPNPKADIAFFEALRIAGDDFDEFEARNAIGKLTDVDVLDCQREGDQYRITLKTPFCDVAHWVKIPTDKDIYFYRRSVVAPTELPHGKEELRYRASAGIELYDSVFAKAEGYADQAAIPAHHKFAVAGELSQQCSYDSEFDPNS